MLRTIYPVVKTGEKSRYEMTSPKAVSKFGVVLDKEIVKRREMVKDVDKKDAELR